MRGRSEKQNLQDKYIYVIVDGSGASKIGVADDPMQRLADLQTGSSVKLRVYGTHSVSYGKAFKIERKIHRILKSRRLNGEWFYIDPKVAMETLYAIIYGGEKPQEILDEFQARKYAEAERGTKIVCPKCTHWRFFKKPKKELWDKKFRCTKCAFVIDAKRLFVRAA